MTPETSKILCGIGALLLLLTLLPVVSVGGLLGIAGIVLLLIGLKGMADHYKDQGIFNNALYGFIIMIVGVVVAVAVALVVMFGILAELGINLTDIGSWALIGPALMGYFTNLANLWGVLSALVIVLVVLFVFLIVSAVFIRKSLNSLAKKTGVHRFGTAGILLLVGAALTIIVVGIVLIWVAFLLVTIAFFQTKIK